MIICGHCHHRHKSAGRVRACAARAGIKPESYEDPNAPTKKQLDYAHALVRQRDHRSVAPELEHEQMHELINEMSKLELRRLISLMLKQPER